MSTRRDQGVHRSNHYSKIESLLPWGIDSFEIERADPAHEESFISNKMGKFCDPVLTKKLKTSVDWIHNGDRIDASQLKEEVMHTQDQAGRFPAGAEGEEEMRCEPLEPR